MENFEKHIRETLQNRELNPSPKAWERIVEQVQDEKPKRPLITWAIAASIAALFIFGLQFFSDDVNPNTGLKTKTNQQQLVGVENGEPKVTIQEVVLENETKANAASLQDDLVAEEPNSPQTKVVIAANEVQHDEKNGSKVIHEAQTILNKVEITDETIALSVNAVLSKVMAIENDSIQVTDAEIDSLLLVAQRQLLAERVNARSSNDTVDAMALLNEVEVELFEADRNQLFDKLRESFFKLRTAVADRNK